MNFHIKSFVICLSLVVLIAGCQNEAADQKPRIQLVVKKEIKVDSAAAQYLTDLYPVATASNSKELIALTNLSNPLSIVVIDYEGQLVDRVGSEGRGPREIMYNRSFGFDNQNNIVINDLTLATIKKFNRSDSTVSSFTSPVPEGVMISSKRFQYCENYWYVAIDNYDALPDTTIPIIGKFDNNFNLIKSFGNFDPYFKGNKSVFQDPRISVDCKNGMIFSTHGKVPFIQVFDLDTFSRITRIDEIPPSFKLSEEFIAVVRSIPEIRQFVIDEQSTSSFITYNNNFIIHPFRNGTEEFKENRDYTARDHYLAVYSRDDYTFLNELPVEGAVFGSTKEGYIIELVNDNPDNFRLRLLEVVGDEDG